MGKKARLIVIAGPTASGKSALALDAARRFGGTIVNADSMQVYGDLRVVTARPTAAEETAVPHRLYGALPGADYCSAGRWRDMALAEIARAEVPILVGGTGLYIRTLLDGIVDLPPIPPEVRQEARNLAARLGPDFYAELALLDPAMASRLRPTDLQRQVRAYEVLKATGRSLAEWQGLPTSGFPGPALVISIDPPADLLRTRIDRRFAAMVSAGALDEVAALDVPDDAPLAKAVGVPELRAHVRGTLSLPAAIAAGQAASRAYAKRQRTWFRHQLASNLVIPEPLWTKESTKYSDKIFSLIDDFLLTGG